MNNYPPGCTPEILAHEDNRLSDPGPDDLTFNELMEEPERESFRCEHGVLLTDICPKCAGLPADPNAMATLRRTLEATRDPLSLEPISATVRKPEKP